MKALKVTALVAGILLALVALGIAVVAWKFDAAWVKQELARTVQEQKQRTLRIDGDLGLSFFPRIGVKLERASLSERASDKEFAAIERARVAVALLPLLSRQLVVERIELAGVRASIVRRKDGSLNVDDLLSKEKEEGSRAKFDIAGIALDNSAIDYRDEATGRVARVSDLSLKTGRLANAASGRLELRAVVEENRLPLQAKVSLDGNYEYDLDSKTYGLEKLDLRIQGDAAGFKGLDAALAARELDWAKGGDILLRQLEASAKSRRQDNALEIRIDAPRLAITAEKASGEAITGVVKLAGKERQLDGKLELSGVEGSAASLKVAKLGAQWNLKQAALAAQGNIAGPLQGDLKAMVFDLPKLAGQLELGHPAMPMKRLALPLDATLHADLGKRSAAGTLATRFDESSIQAKWQIFNFSPLAAGFDLAVDKLDLDKYFPPAPAGKGGDAAGSTGQAGKIDLGFLKGLDLKGAARIGFLQVNRIKLNNVNADIRIRNGRMDVSPLSANLYEGSLSGALSAQAEGNRIAIRQSLRNVSVDPLLKDVAGKDALEGRGQIGLDVTLGGETMAAMKQSLAGSASLSLRDGAIKGINLAKTLREAKAWLMGRQDAVVAASRMEKTDFSELTATFKLAGGVAHNDDFSMKSPFLRAAGAGQIDLGRSRLDYLAKVTVVGTPQGQQGKELEQLKGVTIPVRLTGPFDNLSYRLEFGAMAAEAAKQRLEKELEKQLEKKGLGGALKGLFQ